MGFEPTTFSSLGERFTYSTTRATQLVGVHKTMQDKGTSNLKPLCYIYIICNFMILLCLLKFVHNVSNTNCRSRCTQCGSRLFLKTHTECTAWMVRHCTVLCLSRVCRAHRQLGIKDGLGGTVWSLLMECHSTAESWRPTKCLRSAAHTTLSLGVYHTCK